MKRFLKKVLLFIFCITALVSAFLVFFFTQISPQYTENYQASIIDKVARLESLESPKIILVGNSNLVYGINSELIQEEMRKNYDEDQTIWVNIQVAILRYYNNRGNKK